jgi:predicted outer membrane protein
VTSSIIKVTFYRTILRSVNQNKKQNKKQTLSTSNQEEWQELALRREQDSGKTFDLVGRESEVISKQSVATSLDNLAILLRAERTFKKNMITTRGRIKIGH